MLIILHYSGSLQAVERWLRSLTFGPLRSLHSFSIKIGEQYRWFRNREEFFAAFNQYAREAEGKQAVTAERDLLRDENAALRQLLNFKARSQRPLVGIEVVGRDISTSGQILVVNRGSEAGIASGDPVVAGDGILVGKVISAPPGSALVRLINDNQSRIAATILNKERSLGVIEGGFGISLYLKFIPRDETVVVGEQVIASGLERSVPRGLLIGTIAAVENEPYKPFQQAIVTPATNLSKLTVLGVLIQENNIRN